MSYDVAIIGAGDVGSAIARELARFDLSIALLEAGPDIGAGTSKANTALLVTGFDATPGTVEAPLVARGHDLLTDYAEEVGIPLERTGALLVAWNQEQLHRFPVLRDNAAANGYHRTREVGQDELRRREPHLSHDALGALEVPDEFIVCPWPPPLAFATQAVLAGVELRRDEPVTELTRTPSGWAVTTSKGTFSARWVINAAGLGSDVIHRLAGLDGFTVKPRRGELIVFDKLARPLVSHILLAVPTATTKGVLITPTVFGNVMLGPTADEVEDRDATGSTDSGVERLLDQGRRLMPHLLEQEVTAVYAGLRAATEHKDYQLQVHDDRHYAVAASIRSTGLTAAMAIAEWMRDNLDRAGLELRERPEGLPPIHMPNIGEASLRPYAEAERIADDPAYGQVVCFCERVTRGEIRDAAQASIPPTNLDGLRRRTRVLMGRCQGFYCGAHVAREFEAAGGPPATRSWEIPHE